MRYLLLLFFISANFSQEKFEVRTPTNYSPEKAYPLFLILHGGNSNKRFTQSYWKSKSLSEKFIVAYLEASTLDRAPDRYGWRNLPAERMRVQKYVAEITQKYRVDTTRIFAAGFSNGAKVSLDLALSESLPIRGLILQNHGGGITQAATKSALRGAAKRQLRCVLVVGEKDYRYKKESYELKRLFEAANVEFMYDSQKGVGHTVPDDFSERLDKYVIFLTSKK